MDQTKIWDYYQNEGSDQFRGARPRLAYLVAQLPPRAAVLDIGVGDGTFERLAAVAGHEVHVLDPDPKAIEKARTELRLGDRAQVGFGQSLPWPEASFDAVVLSEVLEHLDDATLRATVAEARRVLRADGMLLGTVPADEDLSAQGVVCPDCGKHFHRWGHAQSFSPDRIRALLHEAFPSAVVRRRWFVAWSLLNWKGRAQALVRQLLALVGIWGTGHNFVFIAHKSVRKPGNQ